MKLTILGASGHGKVVAEIAALCGYDQIEFLDDNEALTCCGHWPVVGKCSLAAETDSGLFVAIGYNDIRKRLIQTIPEERLVTLVHPAAFVSKDAGLGPGTVVMAGSVVEPYARIGKGCIINTCSSADHDCRVGDYVHVAVGAHLGGTVYVGDDTWIGAGAIVVNNTNICGGCTIGAGAVVVRDIDTPGTYVGVPAKRLKER